MKRFLVIAIVAVMALSLLAGCKPAVYKDGTYKALSDATDKGYMAAEVTIAKDKITAVKLSGFNALGLEKPADYAWAEYHKVVADMSAAMVKKNSPDVDIIAKATGSSTQSIQAVKRAMEKALAKPASSAKYFDGTFMSISDKTEKGWTIVWVTLKGDKITDVVLHSTTPAKEKNEDGTPKKDEEGKDIIKKDAAGNVVFERKDVETYGVAAGYTGYKEAKEELPKRFVAKNSAEVDVYTTATGTSNQAKQAVANALASAARK